MVVDHRAEDAGHHAEHREVVARAHADVALLGVGRLEQDAVGHALVGLHGRVRAEPGRDDLAVARLPGGGDEDVVAVVDAAADHAVALHAQREGVVGRHEAAVEGEAPLPVLGQERRLAGVDAAVVRDRLDAGDALVADDPHAPRARRVALDVPLRREGVEHVRHRLRRLDPELLPDLADARLVRVLREEVDEILVDLAFDGRERLAHGVLRMGKADAPGRAGRRP
jgi:hypothetical protein